ncbi:MAG: M3 family oligoendopeptidase, partial [Candidatus Kapabacteria bacterium]|nr:M3 family oligoendopeptidase [Candidatus Kapabacteria bacterium]
LQGALLFLPYACAVDHFQHWVYENPDATPAQRNAKWSEMEATYMPWRDASDVPYAAEGTQWQFQRHIIESPFYYIDYALAQTCALQFWQASQVDRAEAFKDYLHICDIGGSQSFVQIVRSGNLRSPFETGCLDSIVADVKQWLEKEYAGYL